MATTRTRPTDRCEASVAGRQQNQVGAVVAAKAACAGRAVRSLGGGYGISFGVATGTASRATRGAAPYPQHSVSVSSMVRSETLRRLALAHETRGALTTSHTQDCNCTPPCWARRLACSGSATASPGARDVEIGGARARRHGVSREEPRREERRAGAFTAGWSSWSARWAHNPEVVGSNPTPATNYLQGLQGLRARVLDAERCSDSPLCMVAGETGGERPAASSRVAHGAVAEQSCQSALRAAGLESPAIHQSRRVGPRAGRGSQGQAGIIFCVAGGHGDPRWAGKKAGPLRMARGLRAASTGRRGCDTGFDSSATLFPRAPVAQLVEPVRSIRMLRGLHGLCDRANLVGLAAWVGRSSRPGRNFPFREVTK